MRSANELQLKPSRDAKFSQVDCVFQHLKPYDPFMGFVGNEAYDPKAK